MRADIASSAPDETPPARTIPCTPAALQTSNASRASRLGTMYHLLHLTGLPCASPTGQSVLSSARESLASVQSRRQNCLMTTRKAPQVVEQHETGEKASHLVETRSQLGRPRKPPPRSST